METRNKCDAQPSLLGLGCMRLPTIAPDKPEIDFAAAQKIVDAAIAGGITYFDSAYMYHGGTSESFAGEALSHYPRESYYLATKMPLWLLETKDDMERIFAEQLKNCRTEYFDFYLFHAVSTERFAKAEDLGLYDFLAQKKREGRIRRLGFSFHDTPEMLEQVCNTHAWDFAQLQLNYLDWEFQRAKEQYEVLERHGIPCIVMEPVRGGALADLGTQVNPMLQEAAPQNSIASWAMRWVAGLPNVLVVLSGMSNLEQLQDNIATFSPLVPLSEVEQATLQRALTAYKEQKLVPCTGCRYCMDCPCGVDIPGTFKAYNTFSLSKYKPDFVSAMEKMRPDACMACGACVDVCPQNIRVPERMEEIAALAKD